MLALTSDGRVLACGGGSKGQLGAPPAAGDTSFPQFVKGLLLALACGGGSKGQLGAPPAAGDTSFPQFVKGLLLHGVLGEERLGQGKSIKFSSIRHREAMTQKEGSLQKALQQPVAMAKLTGNFSLLLVVLSHVCLSPLLIASAGAPRIARTPSAHKEHRRQRQLTDIVGRGATTRVHTSEDPSAPITYGGGPVMTGNPSINVYIIYYGSWPAGSGQKIIENFIRSLSADSQRQGSPADPKVKRWWAISAAYTQEEEDGTKTNVSSKVCCT
ncbi:unnamed protein product [Closterium sp. NIES-64]|nr:unnamed protein product [Closterium sp. NIES-64]